MTPDCPLINVNALSGLMNLTNIGWFFAIAVGSICAIIVAFQLFSVFKNVPGVIWEILLYGLSVAGIASSFWMPQAGLIPLDAYEVVGCILLAGSIMLTGHVHELPKNTSAFLGTLTVIYAALAVFLQSEPIGFLTVMALIGFCGFGVWTGPLCVVMGYEDEDKIPTGTLVATLLTAAVLNLYDVSLGVADVFKLGATWVGSIVACIGLLIMSTRWYGYDDNRRPPYVLMQLVAIGAYAGAIAFGALAGNDVIMYVGAVFLVIYLSMKPHEIDSGLLGHAFFGLVAAIAIGYGCYWLQGNMADVQAYLDSVRS